MTSAPSQSAARVAKAMQITMGILLVYGLLKLLVIGANLSTPLLSSTTDPIFAVIVVLLGGFWTWTSIFYIKTSKRSKANSELYAEMFDHPDDAFEEGKQKSQNHARRGKILAVMGVTILLLGISYLGLIFVP